MPDGAADQVEFESPLAIPRRTWRESFGLVMRAGWRPFFGWTAGALLLVNGVAAPIWRLSHGLDVHMPWMELAAYVGAVSVLFLPRSVEKITGASQ